VYGKSFEMRHFRVLNVLGGARAGTFLGYRTRSGGAKRRRQLERELPELLSFFSFPKHLWRQLRTTKVIERVFVEVRRRTRPMVCFVNVASVDRIIYRFNLEWRSRTLQVFTQAA